jgi:hypothetical protein
MSPALDAPSAVSLRGPALPLVLACLAACGACTPRRIPAPQPRPTAAQLLTHLRDTAGAAHSFRADSVMDYWIGNERAKGTVLIMGRRGAHARFNALNPTGDSVAVDLACAGSDFTFINYHDNCQLTGPCRKEAIARLLRVSLEADDFLLLAVGATPLLEGARASARWDEEHGHELLELHSPGGARQTIALAGPFGRWRVVSSTLRGPDGQVEWSLENKDFTTIRSPEGKSFQVPGKSRFTQPRARADLLVRWGKRQLNPPLDDSRFQMEVPAHLPRCR